MQTQVTVKPTKYRVLFSGVRKLAEAELSELTKLGYQVDFYENQLELSSDFLCVIHKLSSDTTSLSLLNFLKNNSQVQNIMTDDLSDASVLREVLHQFPGVKFVTEKFSIQEIQDLLLQARLKKESQVEQIELRKLASAKFKELEELNSNLEKIVHIHTSDLKASHQEEKLKLKAERELLQFILEMQRVIDFESALIQIRKKLKTIPQVHEVFLRMKESKKTTLFAWKNGQVISESGSTLSDLPQILARPVGRIEVLQILDQPDIELFVEVLSAEMSSEKIKQQSVHWLNIIRIVLERIIHDDNLFQSSQRWAHIFDGLNSPVAIVSKKFELIRANSKFHKVQNKQYCYQIFADRSEPCEGCPLRPSNLSETIDFPNSKTSQIQLGESLYSVHSHEISPDRFVHYYEDVTKSRTLYAQLVQTEKLGALGALAGQVAHELNNPLSGIRSLSQILQTTTATDSTLFKDLQEIEKAARRCQNIIQQLLEFTKEGGLDPIDSSLNEIIEKTIPLLKTSYRFFRLKMDLAADLPSICVEPQLIQQVIFNLIQNASQALQDFKNQKTDPFHGEITIRTQLVNDSVQFEVIDNGPGIPLEVQPRLFEAFYTTKNAGIGTGLGLYLSRKIMEKFGGHLHFETSEAGTKFIGQFVTSKKAPEKKSEKKIEKKTKDKR